MLNDAHTGVPLPYAGVWATISKAGKVVYDERQWPMLSAYMGPHYGNNVSLPGAGEYQLSLLISPPVSARHVEYENVWLHPHRVNVSFHWTPPRDPPDRGQGRRPLTRRRFFCGRGIAGGGRRRRGVGLDQAEGAQAAGQRPQAAGTGEKQPVIPRVALGRQPLRAALTSARLGGHPGADSDGNPIPPRFDRLLFFDVIGRPTTAHARVLEAALRTLERRYQWGPSGLLFTAGWGPGYFERVLRVPSPIPRARDCRTSSFRRSMTTTCACTSPATTSERLAAVEAALLHGEPLPGADGPLEISSALRWRETRTGFVGDGLPAQHQDVGGIPPGNPVAKTAPLFMGFKSNLRRTRPARTT